MELKAVCNPTSMREAVRPKLVLWENPVGWGGEGGSGCWEHVHPWLIRVYVSQKPPKFCKVISPN